MKAMISKKMYDRSSTIITNIELEKEEETKQKNVNKLE